MSRRKYLSAGFYLGSTFLDNMAIAIVLPILPKLSAQLGAGPGEWIWIVAANGVALSVSPLFWGRIVGTKNANRVIAVTTFVKAFCVVGLLIPGQPWIFLLLNRVLSGSMSGTALAVQVWLVGAERTKQYARPMAKLSVAGGLGVAAGTLLSIPILQAEEAGSLGPTLVLSLLVVFGVLVVLSGSALFFSSEHETTDSLNSRVEKRSGAVDTVGQTRERLWAYSNFAPPVIVSLNLLTRMTFFAFPVLFLLTAESSEIISAPSAAFLIAVLSIGTIVGQFLVVRSSSILGYPLSILIALVVSSTGFVVPMFFFSQSGLLAAAIIVALSGDALQALLSATLVDAAPARVPWWLGVNQAMVGVARTIAPLFVGTAFALGIYGSYGAVAGVSILGLLLLPGVFRVRDGGSSRSSRKNSS